MEVIYFSPVNKNVMFIIKYDTQQNCASSVIEMQGQHIGIETKQRFIFTGSLHGRVGILIDEWLQPPSLF